MYVCMYVRMRQTRDCDLLKHIPKVYYILVCTSVLFFDASGCLCVLSQFLQMPCHRRVRLGSAGGFSTSTQVGGVVLACGLGWGVWSSPVDLGGVRGPLLWTFLAQEFH